MAAKNWYFIVNPHAGSGKTMSEWVIAEKELDKREIPYVSVFTERIGHAKELAYAAACEGYRKFMAVGGDGSVHEVMCGIVKAVDEGVAPASEFFLSVIPIGSGNDWIKTIGIPHDTVKAIEASDSEKTAREDILKARFSDKSSVVSNIAGAGFDSHVCDIVNAQKAAGKRSKRIYAKALVRTIAGLKSINVSVICDGKEVFSGPCYSISIGNGRYSGGGMLQTPGATIDDGQADMLIVPKLPIHVILKEVPKIFKGTIDKSPYTKTVRFRQATIVPLDAASADLVEIDGEVEGRLPVTFEMSGDQINIPASITAKDEK